jgi:hypothetical protein
MSLITYDRVQAPTGELTENFLDAGKNPPVGAIINYYLGADHPKDVSLEILDSDDRVIRTFTDRTDATPHLTTNLGMNRIVWDLRYSGATGLPGTAFWFGSSYGPTAVPGTYKARLKVGDYTETKSFRVIKDPRLPATIDDLQEQFNLHSQVRDKLSTVHESLAQLRDVRQQVRVVAKRSDNDDRAQPLSESANELLRELDLIETELIQTGAKVGYDALRLPIKLNNRLAALIGVIATSDSRPTSQMRDVFDELSAEADVQLERLNSLIEKDVPEFNNQAREIGLPAVKV